MVTSECQVIQNLEPRKERLHGSRLLHSSRSSSQLASSISQLDLPRPAETMFWIKDQKVPLVTLVVMAAHQKPGWADMESGKVDMVRTFSMEKILAWMSSQHFLSMMEYQTEVIATTSSSQVLVSQVSTPAPTITMGSKLASTMLAPSWNKMDRSQN